MTSPTTTTTPSAIERRDEIRARRRVFEERLSSVGRERGGLTAQRAQFLERRNLSLRALAESDDPKVRAEIDVIDAKLDEIAKKVGVPGQASIDPMRPGRRAVPGDLDVQVRHLEGKIGQCQGEEAALIAETRTEWAAAADAASARESAALAEIAAAIAKWDAANTACQLSWSYALHGADRVGDEHPYGMSGMKPHGAWEDRLPISSSEVKRMRGVERVEVPLLLAALAGHLAERGEQMTRPAAGRELLGEGDAYSAYILAKRAQGEQQ